MSTPESEHQQIEAEAAQGRPEWLPEKFQSGEALAQSYLEAEKEMARLREQQRIDQQQFTEALERLEANYQQQAPQPIQQGDLSQDPTVVALQRALAEGDAAAALAIQLGLTQQLIEQSNQSLIKELKPGLDSQQQAQRDLAFTAASDRVARALGDQWTEIQPAVQQWLRDHPTLLPNVNDPAEFEKVIVEGVQIVQAQKAHERLTALEADRAAKLAAQTGTGSGTGRFSTVTDEKKQAWDEVKSADAGGYSSAVRG